MSAHSLTSVVGIGSRLHDLVVDNFRILRMSPSDTGSKEDIVLSWVIIFLSSLCYLMYHRIENNTWIRILGEHIPPPRHIIISKWENQEYFLFCF